MAARFFLVFPQCVRSWVYAGNLGFWSQFVILNRINGSTNPFNSSDSARFWNVDPSVSVPMSCATTPPRYLIKKHILPRATGQD
jgi:hypothetical protein